MDQQWDCSAASMKMMELFQRAQKLPPSQQSLYVSAHIPAIVREGNLKMWSADSAIPTIGRRTVIGIAPYAVLDLKLIDALQQATSEPTSEEEQIEIFDILACAHMKDLEDRVPRIGSVSHTPILGVWENGVLTDTLSGAKARQLLVSRYKLAL